MNPNSAINAISASFELFKGNKDALNRFDTSITGFWQSFSVYLYLIPLYLLSTLVEYQFMARAEGFVAPSLSSIFLIKLGLIGFGAAFFPLVVGLLGATLQIRDQYIRYIVVWNWTTAIAAAAHMLALIPLLLFPEQAGTSAFLILIVILVMLQFRFRIARICLDVPFHVAVALVLLEFFSQILVDILATNFLYS